MNAQVKVLQESSHLYGANAAFIEDLYELYLKDPASVGVQWREYFDRIQGGIGRDVSHATMLEKYGRIARRSRFAAAPVRELDPLAAEKQAAVLRLINAHRRLGHMKADVDPIHLRDRNPPPDLEPATHGLTEDDMDVVFNVGSLQVSETRMKLRDIIAVIRDTYCGHVAAEYMYVLNPTENRWIQKRLEGSRMKPNFSPELKKEILQQITAAEGLERYLHTKYVGQKRFSLEGGEVLIPMLEELLQRAGSQGVKEAVIGMAHRGRLNVLVNIVGKSPSDLFGEFEGRYALQKGSGDVKYHMGFSSDLQTPGGPLHIALGFNPSHLEIINPVVEGSVRARQQRRNDHDGSQVLPILIHGDAAFIGQGVVMETLNLSKTRGYSTGGTIHLVINNQIGFTTSFPQDVRSTRYCTDIAKMIEAPVFHVNGDDPEAAVFVMQLAMDYRTQFKKDVVIDIVCYRRHGHNEADEPVATQPMMYKKIKARETLRKLYAEKLLAEGVIAEGEADAMHEAYWKALDDGEVVSRNMIYNQKHPFLVDWTPYKDIEWTHPAQTALSLDRVRSLGEKLVTVPEGVELHPRVAKIIDDRRKMTAGALPLDWGYAENMAYASLLEEGHPVRLSGQDAGRGTFFHRHAVLHNQKDGNGWVPLQHISDKQARFVVIDSVLSEEAVLGFEYGYSTTEPNGLVLWEAQFGDFANGAQVVIDQFISSGEDKWGRLCGLVMLLPHGYEGQGPEHSSARLERFMQLSAEYNIQVCIPSTPAQMFHMLRRQALRPMRKPLIVMSPKSMLRLPASISSIEDLTNGEFQNVIGEVEALDPKKVTRIVICSGKVYYDLLETRRKQGLDNVAIIRIEQVYPFPREALTAEFAKFPKANHVVWCQEEPKNQGCWYSSRHHFRACLQKGQSLSYAGRAGAPSPATGYHSWHVKQQKALVEQALAGTLEDE